MMFRETVTVYCKNHTEQTNVICGRIVSMLNQVVLVETLGFKG
jgi:hypothetical protein